MTFPSVGGYTFWGRKVSFTALQTSDWNLYTLCKGIMNKYFKEFPCFSFIFLTSIRMHSNCVVLFRCVLTHSFCFLTGFVVSAENSVSALTHWYLRSFSFKFFQIILSIVSSTAGLLLFKQISTRNTLFSRPFSFR